MRDIDKVLLNRKSNRKYEKGLDLNIVKDSVKIAQRTACSMNAQQISIILITDQDKLNKISENNWNQPHIKECEAFLLYCIDHNRQQAVIEDSNNTMHIQDDIESIVVASIDAGLIAQSVELLLQAQDIGTCYIGGVRNNIKEIASLVNLEGISTPILGQAIGMPQGGIINKVEDIRPRVQFDSFFFEENYQIDKVKQGAIDYSKDLTKWWSNKGKSEHQSYAESMNKSYIKSYIPNLFEDLQEMGYLSDYEKKDKQ
ncbi:MAG: nitroreductase family protein [Mycoplasmatales bacterium]